MRWWKWIGLAGLAGVAATGAVIARDSRQRSAYSPDEVRSRLHDRAAEALSGEAETADVPGPEATAVPPPSAGDPAGSDAAAAAEQA